RAVGAHTAGSGSALSALRALSVSPLLHARAAVAYSCGDLCRVATDPPACAGHAGDGALACTLVSAGRPLLNSSTVDCAPRAPNVSRTVVGVHAQFLLPARDQRRIVLPQVISESKPSLSALPETPGVAARAGMPPLLI